MAGGWPRGWRLLTPLCVLATLACGSDERSGPEKPNVVLIIGDDIALSDLEHLRLPHLDRLASRGVSFQRAYAMPVCSPTRYSIVFGRYTGIDSGNACGPPSAVTPDDSMSSLPKLLKRAGYSTALFGKWHLGSNRRGSWEKSPNVHGFDTWRAGIPLNVKHCGGLDYHFWTRVDDGVSSRSREYNTNAIRDAFLAWWKETAEPKFAMVAFQAPHNPFHRPPSDLLPRDYPFQVASVRKAYEAMLLSLDWAVGDMLEILDLKDTWVLFVGDNGTPPAAVRPDQDPAKVKGTTFEDGVKVPLLIAGPGVRGSFRSQALVHTVDLMATIADLVGAELPRSDGIPSASFLGALTKRGTPARAHVYCEIGEGAAHERAVIGERYKLRAVSGTEELYDLQQDPREESPLALGDPSLHEILGELRSVLVNPCGDKK